MFLLSSIRDNPTTIFRLHNPILRQSYFIISKQFQPYGSLFLYQIMRFLTYDIRISNQNFKTVFESQQKRWQRKKDYVVPFTWVILLIFYKMVVYIWFGFRFYVCVVFFLSIPLSFCFVIRSEKSTHPHVVVTAICSQWCYPIVYDLVFRFDTQTFVQHNNIIIYIQNCVCAVCRARRLCICGMETYCKYKQIK